MKRPVVLLVDVVGVVVFALVGRLSHGEALGLGELARTAAPFLAGLLLGWVLLLRLGRPGLPWRDGVIVWAPTGGLGLAFRALSGDGTAAVFVLTTAVFVGLLLLGWRLVWRLVARSRPAGGAPGKDPRRSGNPARRDAARRRP